MDRVDLSPPEPFSGLIFDCDGTLADTAMMHYGVCSAVMAQFGVTMPWAWYLARVGLSLPGLLKALADEFGTVLDPADVLARALPLYSGKLEGVREVPVVAAIARRFAGVVPMAVASAGQRVVVEGTLEAIGLRKLFGAVVAMEDVRRGKPAPDLFLEAARRLAVPAAECVVYEDTDEGLEAARRAGMRAVDVRPAWQPEWRRAVA